jgi:hypothetical protein
MNDYELDENSGLSQPRQSVEYSEDDFTLDSRIASQNQYYGCGAAEKWLFRVYLRRCCRFLLSKLGPVKPVNNTPDDDLPF